MKAIRCFLTVTCFAIAATSCSQTFQAKVPHPETIRSAKSAHVVRHENSNRDIDLYLKNALVSKGVRATNGPGSRPADLEVTYVDRWHWDLAMYLRTLDVSVTDPKTGKEVASAIYRNSFIHVFPDAEKTSQHLVDDIFSKAGH
ncbi:MAG: hypothetical protein QM755_12725 [Luteolibacter sp.]